MLDQPRTTASGAIEVAFSFSEDFAGFAGHFPDNPVLPGIVQIVAVLCAVDAFDSTNAKGKQGMREIRRCKFLRPVLPGETLLVNATLVEHMAGTMVQANLSVNGGLCASLKLVLSPQELGNE